MSKVKWKFDPDNNDRHATILIIFAVTIFMPVIPVLFLAWYFNH